MEIFAHRGWSHIYLDNSMDAFLAAAHLESVSSLMFIRVRMASLWSFMMKT